MMIGLPKRRFLCSLLTGSVFISLIPVLGHASYRLAGRDALHRGEYVKAERLLHSFLKRWRSRYYRAQAHYLIGHARFAQKQYALAAKAFRKARHLPHLGDYVLFHMGESQWKAGKCRKAARTFLRLIKKYGKKSSERKGLFPSPFTGKATMRMGESLASCGRCAAARKWFRRARRKHYQEYSGPSALEAQANCWLKKKRPSKTVDTLRNLAWSYPRSSKAAWARNRLKALASKSGKRVAYSMRENLRRAWSLGYRGYYRRALAILAELEGTLGKIRRKRRKVRYLAKALKEEKAAIYMRRKEYEQAAAIYGKLARKHGRKARSYWESSAYALYRAKKYKSARAAYSRLYKKYRRKRFSLEYLNMLNHIHRREGAYAKAAGYLLEISRRARHWRKKRKAFLQAVKLHYHQGLYKSAAKLAGRFVKRFKRGWGVYPMIWLEAWCQLKMRRPLKARRLLSSMDRRYRGDARARYWMARIDQNHRKWRQAARGYFRTIKEDPIGYYGNLARSRLLESPSQLLKKSKVDWKSSPPLPDSWAGIQKSLALPYRAPGPGIGNDPEMVAALERSRKYKVFAKAMRRYKKVLPQFGRALELWRLGFIGQVRKELWRAQKERAEVGKRLRRARKAGANARLLKRLNGLSRISRRRLIGSLNRLYLEAGDHYHYYLNRVRFYPRPGGRKPGKRDEARWRRIFPRPFRELVAASAKAYRLPDSLVYAVIRTESAYQPDAVSRLGARGLIQIMPRTGRRIARYCSLGDYETGHLFTPRINLNMGSWYLAQMLHRFQGQLILGLAAYNAGPHNVSRWFKELNFRGSDEFVEEIPFKETRQYVKRLIGFYGIYEWLYHRRDSILVPLKVNRNERPSIGF